MPVFPRLALSFLIGLLAGRFAEKALRLFVVEDDPDLNRQLAAAQLGGLRAELVLPTG